MRIGHLITYVDTRGNEHPATLTEITGGGPSGYKEVTLKHGEKQDIEVKAVPHYLDAKNGKGPYWLLPEEAEQWPDRRAPLEKQPIKMAKAEAKGDLPASDRRGDG